MELVDLRRMRVGIPMALFAALSWPFLRENTFKIDLPFFGEVSACVILGGIAGWIYDALRIRDIVWKPEQARYVGNLIRTRLKSWIPTHLNLSQEEFTRLYEADLIRGSNGIYWRAVDRDESLTGLKERFYENGLPYSTCFDVVLIFGPASILYLVTYSWTENDFWSWWAYGTGAASVISASLISVFRKRHIELTNEQLDRFADTQLAYFQGEVTRVVSARRALLE